MAALKKTRLTPACGEIPSLLTPEARIDLRLDSDIKTGTIRGVVTDLSGKPVPEAMVQLAKNRFEPVVNSLTQQDGSFVLSDIPAQTQYWLYAGGKGLVVSDSPPFLLLENQEIIRHIRLRPQKDDHLICMAGKVTDGDGLPSALSVVLVFKLADEVMNYHSMSLCDESGKYMVTDLEPGPYLMRIISEGCPPVIQSIQIGHGDRLVKLDFVLSNS